MKLIPLHSTKSYEAPHIHENHKSHHLTDTRSLMTRDISSSYSENTQELNINISSFVCLCLYGYTNLISRWLLYNLYKAILSYTK